MKKEQILLIENDFLIIKDIKNYFNILNFEVYQLDSIDYSLSFLENNNIDVIIANLGSIENNKVIYFSELISQRFNINIIYIIDEQEKETLLGLKFQHPISYITKPYLIEDLFELVKKEIYYGKIQKKIYLKNKELEDLKKLSISNLKIDFRDFYKYVINSIPTPIFVTQNEKILFMNNYASDILGISNNQNIYDNDILEIILSNQDHTIVKLKKHNLYLEENVYSKNITVNNNILNQISFYFKGQNEVDEIKDIDKIVNQKTYHFRQNLQLFSSLLNIEARNLKNKTEEFLKDFNANFNRFRVIFMLYSFILDEDKTNSLKFKDYLIKIVNHLYHVYQISFNHLRVEWNVTDFDIYYNNILNYAFIINEIISLIINYNT